MIEEGFDSVLALEVAITRHPRHHDTEESIGHYHSFLGMQLRFEGSAKTP